MLSQQGKGCSVAKAVTPDESSHPAARGTGLQPPALSPGGGCSHCCRMLIWDADITAQQGVLGGTWEGACLR